MINLIAFQIFQQFLCCFRDILVDIHDIYVLSQTGAECNNGRIPRERVAVCSQKRALCVTATVLGALLGIALLIAYAGPQSCKFLKF